MVDLVDLARTQSAQSANPKLIYLNVNLAATRIVIARTSTTNALRVFAELTESASNNGSLRSAETPAENATLRNIVSLDVPRVPQILSFPPIQLAVIPRVLAMSLRLVQETVPTVLLIATYLLEPLVVLLLVTVTKPKSAQARALLALPILTSLLLLFVALPPVTATLRNIVPETP